MNQYSASLPNDDILLRISSWYYLSPCGSVPLEDIPAVTISNKSMKIEKIDISSS